MDSAPSAEYRQVHHPAGTVRVDVERLVQRLDPIGVIQPERREPAGTHRTQPFGVAPDHCLRVARGAAGEQPPLGVPARAPRVPVRCGDPGPEPAARFDPDEQVASRQRGGGLGHHVGEVVVDDRGPGSGDLQQVPHLGGPVPVVDVHRRGHQLEQGVQRDQVLR
jgi:hypothetical protein